MNTLVSPVISKIFTMRGSATTTCRSPPSSRQRLSAPTSTPECGGVEEGHPQQVQDDRRLALGDHAVQALPQLRRRGDVDLPADRDDRRRGARPLLYVKLLIHSALLPSWLDPGPCRDVVLQWRLARAFYSPWTQNLNLRVRPGFLPTRVETTVQPR